MNRKPCLVTVISIFLVSCAGRRPVQFESVPARPYYILRNPARLETPYPEVLAQHGDPVQGWVDLTRSMAIKIEKLIFADPGAAQNIANFVGTESALFDVADTGRLTNMRVQELANRPAQESPISSLLGTRFQKLRFHRLYFQVLLDRRSGESAAVLLGADSREALRRQDLQLKANARAVLGDGEANSVIFPPNVTVSLQFEIIVNGKPASVSWGSSVKNVIGERSSFSMLRRYGRRNVPVNIDAKDPEALRLSVLPGDRFIW